MNKLDLQEMTFTPPLEWLAVPKDGRKPFTFTFKDIGREDCGSTEAQPQPFIWRQDSDSVGMWRKCYLSDCHLCGFTGYTDSEGEKVFGGHLLKTEYRGVYYYGIVIYRKDGWKFRAISKNWEWPRESDLGCLHPSTIIAHIHDKEYPEEVRRLLT